MDQIRYIRAGNKLYMLKCEIFKVPDHSPLLDCDVRSEKTIKILAKYS